MFGLEEWSERESLCARLEEEAEGKAGEDDSVVGGGGDPQSQTTEGGGVSNSQMSGDGAAGVSSLGSGKAADNNDEFRVPQDRTSLEDDGVGSSQELMSPRKESGRGPNINQSIGRCGLENELPEMGLLDGERGWPNSAQSEGEGNRSSGTGEATGSGSVGWVSS